MRIEFDDEEYPELALYLKNPKRKMRFLYYLEELFSKSNFDPVESGIEMSKTNSSGSFSETNADIKLLLTEIANSITALSKNMEGSVIGRFPTEHVVHEIIKAPESKKQVVVDEDDYSSTEGIDFSAAIAMFED